MCRSEGQGTENFEDTAVEGNGIVCFVSTQALVDYRAPLLHFLLAYDID